MVRRAQVSLIREINDLRREINFLKHERVSLQVRARDPSIRSSVCCSAKSRSRHVLLAMPS